jgi:hypothetical protein
MRNRHLVSAGSLALLLGLTSPAFISVASQAPAQAQRSAAAPVFTPPPSTYTPPRTPWGDPDLQGVWDYQSMIPMQRPAELAGKKVFTEAELAEWAKTHTPNQDSCGVGTRANEKCTDAQLKSVGAYNEFWDNRNIVKDHRTSLIEDPPNGRFPPMLPEAQARQKEIVGGERGGPEGPERAIYNSWEDFPAITRCIAEQTPNGVQMYNSGTYIMQTPGWVTIVRERLDTRVIPLDGRPHPTSKIHQWNGHSVGRFEGNTLVVDTTNFTDKQVRGGVGSTVPGGVPMGNIHLIERFVPVAANRIHYYATIEDPTTWTQPWTFMLPWERDPSYQIFEYACHEGNISVGNSLRGERALEAEEAAKKGNK